MTLEPTSTHYENDLESDLTVLPGWKDADRTLKARLVDSGEAVHSGEGSRARARGMALRPSGSPITFHLPALAGYRAFRLLLQEEEDFVVSPRSRRMEKGGRPLSLAIPLSGGVGAKESSQHPC